MLLLDVQAASPKNRLAEGIKSRKGKPSQSEKLQLPWRKLQKKKSINLHLTDLTGKLNLHFACLELEVNLKTKMKYHCPVAQTIGPKPFTKNCAIPITCKGTAALKPVRNVHFPNDIVFQDYVRQGEMERIGLFVRSNRVSLDTIYPSGMAAIHEAVLSGNLDCVKLLVSYGADIHQRDEEGWTPLHMACSDDYPHIARYLLSLGADRDLENECGEKPEDLIDPDSMELLELFGISAND